MDQEEIIKKLCEVIIDGDDVEAVKLSEAALASGMDALSVVKAAIQPARVTTIRRQKEMP